MTDRPPKPQETVATRAAFRAGVKGLRYTENPDPDFDIPVATDNTPGPNERHFETVVRLPGLSDPEAAYEAGRALRMSGHIRKRIMEYDSTWKRRIGFFVQRRRFTVRTLIS
jgi:hypothetical protein